MEDDRRFAGGVAATLPVHLLAVADSEHSVLVRFGRGKAGEQGIPLRAASGLVFDGTEVLERPPHRSWPSFSLTAALSSARWSTLVVLSVVLNQFYSPGDGADGETPYARSAWTDPARSSGCRTMLVAEGEPSFLRFAMSLGPRSSSFSRACTRARLLVDAHFDAASRTRSQAKLCLSTRNTPGTAPLKAKFCSAGTDCSHRRQETR